MRTTATEDKPDRESAHDSNGDPRYWNTRHGTGEERLCPRRPGGG